MELTESQKKTVRHQFDSFSRKVVREEARNYIKAMKRLSDHEIPFSALSEEQIERFSALDTYPSLQHHFDVQGYSVVIEDDRLATALASLTDEQRDIVLLSYFLEMNDREIGERLNILRRTVQKRRTISISKIKERMEDKIDDSQSN